MEWNINLTTIPVVPLLGAFVQGLPWWGQRSGVLMSLVFADY